MADFELSTYQKDILDYFVKNPQENIFIDALAGAGKSSTICLLTEKTNTQDVYIAFNKSIAEEFKTKIKNPKTKVYTIHSLAYMIMLSNLEEQKKSKSTLDNLKVYKIIDEKIQEQYKYEKFEYKIFLKDGFVQLYNLCRLTCTDMSKTEVVSQIAREYNLFYDYSGRYEVPSKNILTQWIAYIDSRSTEEFEKNSIIDFTDMLYVTFNKLRSREWKVPYYALFTNIMLDESQDFTNLQLFFLKYIKRKQGRYVFVGDKNQAIYGWAGASCHSCDIIKSMFAPIKEFSLPINYRCPKIHLQMVNEKFGIPIKPRLNAPEGKIKTIDKNSIPNYIQPGDFIIARKNKWLADVLIPLIEKDVPIYIEDKEMVDNIFKSIKKEKVNDVKSLSEKFEKKKADYRKNLSKTKKDDKISDNEKESIIIDTNSVIDNIDFTLSLLDHFKQKKSNATISEFESYLKKMLSTTPNKKSVRMSSIHKCKGLEAENVFVLNEGKICFDPRNSFDLNQQERNLSYISLTRAKNNMYLVREPSAE